MAPRQPPESPDDDKHSELLDAVHRALDDAVPMTDPVEDQPLAETQPDLPEPELPEPEIVDKTKVEIDRIEAYMKGPTAFTA